MNRPESIDPASHPDKDKADPRSVIGFCVLVVGSFLAFLDMQIIASALGHLSASLGATLEEVAWAQSAYLIAEIVVIPLTGWLTQGLSTRYLFSLACGGFSIASLLCACAWNLPSMIAFRALQGLCGGLLIPMIFTSIFVIFPLRQQPFVTMLAGIVSLTAPVIGPIIGGYIVNYASWHWLFLLNLPLAVPASIIGYLYIHHDQPDFARLRRFDIPGIVSLVLFLGCGDFVLKEGIRFDWFSSNLIILMTIITAAAFSFFVWWELRCLHPVVTIRLFRSRNFTVSCVIAFVHGVNMYAPMYLIPAILTAIAHYDSITIGKTLLISGVTFSAGFVFSHRFAMRFGQRATIGIGLAFAFAGCWIDSHMTATVSAMTFALGQVLRGLAYPCIGMPNMLMAMDGLAGTAVAQASGLYNVTRNLGGAVGISLATWLIQARNDHHVVHLSEAITEGRLGNRIFEETLASARELPTALPPQTGFDIATLQTITALVHREAAVLAYADTWLLFSYFGLMGLCAVPFLPPKIRAMAKANKTAEAVGP